MDRKQIISDVEKYKIIVILRGLNKEQLLNSVEAFINGGIRFVEVTFDQSGKISDEETAENIKAIKERFGDAIHVGAGTVMTTAQVKKAYKAGAEFIISPDCYKAVIKKTRKLNMVSMPGVFTPTEAANAHRYGADFVKLFPNSEVKSSYLKSLSAPLSHIKFLSVGGVNHLNLKEFLDAGAKGVGVATGIADKTAIANGDYEKLTFLAKQYTEQI